MERASRPSIASREDVFETHRGTRAAGACFSPAGISLEATLEATATRGFDFMEDRPLDARGRTGNTGTRGAPRGDKRTTSGCAGGSGRRVASLFELLQELSSPRAQSSTSSRGRTLPKATASPPATNSLLGGTSASGTTASAGRHEASGAGDRLGAKGEADGTRLRSVSEREKSPAQSSLGGPARPALRREDDPRDGFSSKEARRVTFAATKVASREHATIGAPAQPPPTHPATLLDEQWQKSDSAAIIPSRPKRPAGIQGVANSKGSAKSSRRPLSDPTQGAAERVALGSLTPGNARGENRASAVLTASSAARSEALPKMASSAGHVNASEGESGSEERSAKRRRGYARELHGGSSTLVGAAGRPESRRRDMVGVGRPSGGGPSRGGGGDGWMSPAERAVERVPRVGNGSKQGVPQGGYEALTGQGGAAVDSWTNQGQTPSMWMRQEEDDVLDSEQQGLIESRSQYQAPGVQNAGQVRRIRPPFEQVERKVGIERQGGGGAAVATDTGNSAFVEKRDGGLAEREAQCVEDGEQEWSHEAGAGDNAGHREGDKGDPKRELVRVRGLCHMRGGILALVEWSVADAEGSACTELSFMLSSALKADWPQQYITFLEERMVFDTEEEAYVTQGEARSNPSSATAAAAEGAGSALEVWKLGGPTTSHLPA